MTETPGVRILLYITMLISFSLTCPLLVVQMSDYCEPDSLLGAGIAQLVVLGLAVHSVAGSILLWGHFPIEGIFPLELTWVPTPFPPKLLRLRV